MQITPQLVKQLRDRTGISVGKCKEALEEAGGNIDLAIENLRKAGIASAIKKEGRETKEGVIKVAQNTHHVALVEINAETDFVVKNENFQKLAQDLADEVCTTAPSQVSEFLKQSYSKDASHTIDEFRASMVQSFGENIQIKRLKVLAKKSDVSIAVYSHMGGKLVTLVEILGSSSEEELAKDIAMHIAAEAPDYLSRKDIPQHVLEQEKDIASSQLKNVPEHQKAKSLEGKLNVFYKQACLMDQSFVKDPAITIAELIKQHGKKIGKDLTLSYFLRWRVGE